MEKILLFLDYDKIMLKRVYELTNTFQLNVKLIWLVQFYNV